jgi:RNA polymerase sigma-70 factor (ECF subfamily)
VFKRNRFDGRTQREIAEELGISQTAVEKHIRKALARLAAHRHEA